MSSHSPNVNFLMHVGTVIRVKSLATKSGDPMVSVSYKTTDRWKDKKTQEYKEACEFFNITLFDDLAAYAENNVSVGSIVFLKGSLRTRKYTNKDGVEVTAREPQVAELSVLSGAAAARPSNPAMPASQLDRDIPTNDFDDEIPF